jgi:hypothetical protein
MKKSYLIILGALAAEVLLVALILLAGLFASSYFEANLIVWEHFGILRHASGADAFWMALYLFSDALLFMILVVLFAEVVLLLVRTAAKIVFKAVEKTMGVAQDKALAFVKKISILTLFRWLKVNTIKKGILTYVAVIALMLLSGWIPKLVLEQRQALVFRTFETKNLYSNIDAPDFSAEIAESKRFDLVILGGVANVHVYQVSQTVEAKLYLLYDEARVLDDYVWTVDRVNGVIRIEVNRSQTTYVPYVDLVLPSVELYLPADLAIGVVVIDIETHGSVVIDYLSFETMDIVMKKGDLNVRQVKDSIAKSVSLTAVEAKVTVQFERVETLSLTLDQARANVRARAIDHLLTIEATNGSNLFMYQITAERLDGVFVDSTVQFREIYAPTINIESNDTSFLLVNGLSSYPYLSVSIRQNGGETTLRGLPDDALGN